MIIQGNANISPAAGIVRPYQPPAAGNGAAQSPKEDLTRRFDIVTISGESGRYNSVEKDLQSKLSQEVRAATPSETITALREQVRSGAYQPDPMEIARKMLLMGETV